MCGPYSINTYSPHPPPHPFHPLDINEFYTYTLEDDTKNINVKTAETCNLAERWEGVSPPVPAPTIDIAKKTLDHDVRKDTIDSVVV